MPGQLRETRKDGTGAGNHHGATSRAALHPGQHLIKFSVPFIPSQLLSRSRVFPSCSTPLTQTRTMEQAQGDPGRQEQASRVLTQAADGGIAGPDTGLGLDAFVNASHLNLGQATAAASAGIDWEHIDRSPTGSTITDGGAVIDESGRTFHGYKEGKYFLPNDAAEQDRLDLQHAGFQHLFEGKLYRAPLQNPRNVLDIATGTGIWAMDFGVPISPSLPAASSGDY